VNREDRSGAETRFEELYRATAQDLLAFLARRASDPEEATDILAEVYMVAWRRRDKVPADSSARLWLFGIARNLLMKSNEQQRSHQALVHDLRTELSRIASAPTEPADAELNDRVRASVQKLPVKQREVLLLTAWEGLKPREIAKVTGSTANVVRVRLHHARGHLRRELRPSPSPDDGEGATSQSFRHLIGDVINDTRSLSSRATRAD
jgi:RNA polymerase sigma-70 factor (ECF subfamily)